MPNPIKPPAPLLYCNKTLFGHTKATSKSDSLRTTVPKLIIRTLNLKDGDRIRWELKPQNNQFVVTVTSERK
jgi:hypothetical protein